MAYKKYFAAVACLVHLVALAFAVGPAHLQAASSWMLVGKVIHVDDGDTLVMLQPDLSRVSIRLSDIDAPEISHGTGRPGQPFSRASQQSLIALTLGQTATAKCYEEDRWRRPVCTVHVAGIDVNAEQLRKGMAWANRANRRYVRDANSFELEALAKRDAIGIWSGGGQAAAPWEWRQQCWKLGACQGSESDHLAGAASQHPPAAWQQQDRKQGPSR